MSDDEEDQEMWRQLFGEDPPVFGPPTREEWAELMGTPEEQRELVHDLFGPPRDAEIIEFPDREGREDER